ncbi:MAG: hypothetical protein ACI33M_02110 [Lysinibacillus sp.]
MIDWIMDDFGLINVILAIGVVLILSIILFNKKNRSFGSIVNAGLAIGVLLGTMYFLSTY